jgi:predicted NodU family carbamoyl transferase
MPRKHSQKVEEHIRLDPRLQARLEDKKSRLDLHRPLAPTIVSRLYEDLRIRLTYHSNAIDRNFLQCLIIHNDLLESSINPREFPHCSFINHHLSHAYSTFFTSPFDKSAILVVNGAGSLLPERSGRDERETTSG